MQLKIQPLLIEKIVQADRAGANELLDGWAAENGYERLFLDILDPVLIRIGEAWYSSGSVTLAQLYVAAKVVEDVMGKIAERSRQSLDARPQKGPVVVGNTEEDFHAMFFQAVDPGTLVREVIRELGPDTVGRKIEWRTGDLPTVSADASLLRMVLVNLIANALKYTRPRDQADI
jgi:signal transduction histidine kinase